MQTGDLWNGWKIDQFIGEGSFGRVFRIVREEFGHTYEAALKVLEIPQNQSEVDSVKNEGMDDESVTYYFKSIVEDFVEEFALMSKLKGNSNIVSYEDHQVTAKENEFGWTVYIRMELLTPLYTYLKTHTLTIREVIKLGIDMCQALETCQKYNIIHRDIKPENIFVSDLGGFKLGDFGIARQLEKTTSGLSKKGTYSYMAPEVYKGLPYNSTVDIYSLGIVLYRFLNDNRTPFMPPSPQPIRYSDKENANTLRLSGKAMPSPVNAEGRLAEIILKACAYDPSDRYDSASDMKNALQSIAYSEVEAKLIYPAGDSFLNMTGLGYTADIAGLDENTYSSDTLSMEDDTVYLFSADQKKSEIRREKERKGQERERVRQEEEKARRETEKKIRRKEEERIWREEEEKARQEEERTEKESGNSEEKQTEQKILEQRKKPAGKKISAAVVAVLCLVVFAGGMKVYQASLKCEMPDIVNLSEKKAKQVLKEAQLDCTPLEEYSDTVEKGYVISQQYRAGEIVKKGISIKVVISKGALVRVPDVVNISKENAKAKIEKAGFNFEVKEELYSDQVSSGRVISQDLAAGAEEEEGSKICVVISKGIEQVEVPSLKGLTVKDAKEKLKKVKLKYKLLRKEYSASIKKGRVISQSVKAGKKINKNSIVSVVISIGGETVPDPVIADRAPYVPPQAPVTNYVPSAPSAPVQNDHSINDGSSRNQNSDEDNLDSWDLVN